MAGRFDSWDSYLWEPDGAVLRNIYGERDAAVLARMEYTETAKQQLKIERGETEIQRTYDAEHLRAVHYELFKNVYAWAGEDRTVGIRKGPTDFSHTADIGLYLCDAAKSIRSRPWSGLDREEFARAAAETFSYVNQAHPFREGNGRAAKLFMQHVAEMSPWRIDYNPGVSGVSEMDWRIASLQVRPAQGTYPPRPERMVPVFEAMAQPRIDQPSPAVAAKSSRQVIEVNRQRIAEAEAKRDRRGQDLDRGRSGPQQGQRGPHL